MQSLKAKWYEYGSVFTDGPFCDMIYKKEEVDKTMRRFIMLFVLLLSMAILIACAQPTPKPVVIQEKGEKP